MDLFKRVCKSYCIEIAYSIFTMIFLCMLKNLNNTLLSKYAENDYLAILTHNNYSSLYYFLITLVLTIIGICISIHRFRQFMNFDLDKYGVIFNILSILMMIILIFLLWVFINNPILRAIIACIVVGGLICAK